MAMSPDRMSDKALQSFRVISVLLWMRCACMSASLDIDRAFYARRRDKFRADIFENAALYFTAIRAIDFIASLNICELCHLCRYPRLSSLRKNVRARATHHTHTHTYAVGSISPDNITGLCAFARSRWMSRTLCAMAISLFWLLCHSSRNRLCRLFRCPARCARVWFLRPYRAGCFIVIQLSPPSRHYLAAHIPLRVSSFRRGQVDRSYNGKRTSAPTSIRTFVTVRLRRLHFRPIPRGTSNSTPAVLCHSRTLCRSTWISALLSSRYLISRPLSLSLSLDFALFPSLF